MTRHDALRKKRIVEYIAATVRQHGYPPSVREIAAAVGLASTSGRPPPPVGARTRGRARARRHPIAGLRLKPAAALAAGVGADVLTQRADATTRSLPIVGEIAAGGPIEAYQDASESVSVPDLIGGSPDTYVLRVRGDSMMDAHILDGDLVVIRPQQNRAGR